MLERDILDIIYEDRMIIGGNKNLKIISLLGKKIIKEIELSFEWKGIKIF